MSLGRIVGTMALAVSLAIVGALLLLGYDQRAQMRREAEQQLQSTAYLLADHAGRLFEVSDVALFSAAAQVQGKSWPEIAESPELSSHLKLLATTLPYIEDVWLNDESGLLRLTSFAFPAPLSNAADRESFLAVKEPQNQIYIGDRIIGRITKRPTFLLARRVPDESGAFRGMVSVTADLAYFNDYWSRMRLPYGASVTLVRAKNLDVLAQHPAPPEGQAFAGIAERELRDAIAHQSEGAVFDAVSGVGPEISAFQKVGTLPLYILLTMPRAALEEAWSTRMWSYAAFAAAALLALALLTVVGFRQARRERIAKEALDKARRALVEANTGLEVTVAERTADLRASESRYRLILESAADYAILTMDLSGIITEWNVGARNLLGWDRQAALGRHARMIFTAEDQAAGQPETEIGMALTEGRSADERWYVRRDGSRFFAAGALLPMSGEGGAPIGFLKILRDRTQQFEIEEARRSLNETLEQLVKERTAELGSANERLLAEAAQRERAEEQLRQSQKMEAVGRLTGGVAHDFNNLLTVVTGNLDMLRRRVGPDAEARIVRLIDHAMEGATRAAALTYRLLAFSRQQPLAPVPVDANKLVAGISDLLRRTLGENIAVETVLGGGLWRTHADPNQLENAILNLAVNARDAMPDGGKLTIETANASLDQDYAGANADVRPGQYVLIAVTDTGSGMTPDVSAKAFDPFFTTKPVGKGTGLGLSQVYGFAKQSNGHAAIYSEPGVGTTVKIYLPRFRQATDDTRPAGAEPRRAPPRVQRGRGETILVVEDEQMVREFSVSALEEAGYVVLAAEDGPSGLAMLDSHPETALLFTDVVLSGPMNGRKVADEALRRRPLLKVLFTTGYTRNAIIHHGRLDDGVEFLGKPFTAAQLTERVGVLLQCE
jgi:PAS domain S-box-containing protein